MKMKEIRRMLRTPKKDANDSKDKTSSRKQPTNRNRRRGGAKADDDSVDSDGNIRDLIAYSDEEEEITSSEEESVETSDSESEGHLSPEEKRTIRREARRAAVKARERIKKASKKLAKKKRIVESDDEEEEEDTRRKRRSSKKRKEETESEEEEEDEEEEYDEDDDEDEDDEEDEEEEGTGPPEISISIGGFGGGDDFMERMIPKRHNMKKESEDVKKFVKLVTKPLQANTIDDQIDNFKELPQEKQKQMIEALEKKPQQSEQNLMFKILTMNMPPDTQSMILAKYHSLQTLDTSSGEFFKLRNWLEKVTSLPLGIYKEIPVKMNDGSEACSSFMERARRCLEDAIYGQEEAKLQIMQFIATKIANPGHRGLSLLLTGPPGIGKTSLIRNGIAKSLAWPFQFISLET